jgi:hypothetical protein
VTIAGVTTQDHDTIGPLLEGLEYEEGVNPPRARDADDAQRGRVDNATGARQVSSWVAAPPAKKTDDSGFEICHHQNPPNQIPIINVSMTKSQIPMNHWSLVHWSLVIDRLVIGSLVIGH